MPIQNCFHFVKYHLCILWINAMFILVFRSSVVSKSWCKKQPIEFNWNDSTFRLCNLVKTYICTYQSARWLRFIRRSNNNHTTSLYLPTQIVCICIRLICPSFCFIIWFNSIEAYVNLIRIHKIQFLCCLWFLFFWIHF